MADDAAFLRAILVQPEADLPRRIYADYLDERGESDRAEFIRVQCDLARHPFANGHDEAICTWCAYNDCPIPGWRRRERELLGDSVVGLPFVDWQPLTGREWWGKAALSVRLDAAEIACEFHRGFVAAVTCTLADFQQHGPAILACQPVERVTLADRRPYLPHLAHRMSGDRHYAWYGLWQPEYQHPYVIGEALLSHLTQPVRGNSVWYAAEADAQADLSRAAIAWATAEAKRLGLGVYGDDLAAVPLS